MADAIGRASADTRLDDRRHRWLELKRACAAGRLDDVQQMCILLKRLGPTVDRNRGCALLRLACHGGHLATAQQLVQEFPLAIPDSAEMLELILQTACAGRLDFAQWLYATFGLTADDVRADSNLALRNACAGGHLVFAQWLHATFGPAFRGTPADVNADELMSIACALGYLDIVQWIYETFTLVASKRAKLAMVLVHACGNGHLSVAQWICTTYGFTADDEKATLRRVMFSADDARAEYTALRRAYAGGHLSILCWLQRTWGLPPAALAVTLTDPPPQETACTDYLRGLHQLRWSPRTHPEYPLATRRLALLLLLIRGRLAHTSGDVPTLPTELWLHLLSYLPAW